MVCDEKIRLVTWYVAATERQTLATEKLARSAKKLLREPELFSKAEYDRLLNDAHEARFFSEQCRADLQQHVAEHGCSSNRRKDFRHWAMRNSPDKNSGA